MSAYKQFASAFRVRTSSYHNSYSDGNYRKVEPHSEREKRIYEERKEADRLMGEIIKKMREEK